MVLKVWTLLSKVSSSLVAETMQKGRFQPGFAMAQPLQLHVYRKGVSLSIGRFIYRFFLLMERIPPFIAASLSAEGIFSHEGRLLIWGKLRRLVLSLFPPLAHALQRYYGLAGACNNCGASCKLLFQCPHWDDKSKLCTVYHDRPSICRTFPITPADLRDRDLVSKRLPCGFAFAPKGAPWPAKIGPRHPFST